MLELVISEKAEYDLKDIYSYLTEVSSEAIAWKLLQKIERKFYILTITPHLGRVRDDVMIDLRQTLVGKYLIFYIPTDKEIKIVRILHSSRDYKNMIKR